MAHNTGRGNTKRFLGGENTFNILGVCTEFSVRLEISFRSLVATVITSSNILKCHYSISTLTLNGSNKSRNKISSLSGKLESQIITDYRTEFYHSNQQDPHSVISLLLQRPKLHWASSMNQALPKHQLTEPTELTSDEVDIMVPVSQNRSRVSAC